MEGIAQSGPSALIVVLTGGLAVLLVVLAFLIYRTGLVAPTHKKLFHWASGVSLVCGGLLFLFFMCELTARFMIPGGYLRQLPHRGSDPGAIVEMLPDGQAYWEYRGLWEFDENALRKTPEVAEPALLLGIAGDSVTYGVDVPAEKRFIHLLAQRLQERCGPIQLLDAAVPGYSLLQERLAVQRKVMPRKPDLLFVGVYSNDMTTFTVIGSTAFDMRVRFDRGFPVFSFLPLPDELNALLLHHSVFYQWVTLRGIAAADRAMGRDDELNALAIHNLDLMRLDCVEQGCRIVVALFPDLSAPLTEPELPGTAQFYNSVRAWAKEAAVPMIDVRQMLADQDYLQIRLDECCHFNEEGHAVIADRLEGEFDRLELLSTLCR